MKLNSNNEFVLRTRKIESYFRGKLIFNTNEKWGIICLSYSGGNVPILNILEYRGKTQKKLIEKIKKFKKKHKLLSTDK